jgi:FKBP-type peptidyl-prolyl cis-trans isomerase FkpA
MKKTLIGALVVTVLLSSCLKSVDPPVCDPTYNPCAVVAPAGEIASVENYLSSKGITDATKHCSGMYYKIDTSGSGETADLCSQVTFNYKGELTDGTVFQETTSPVTLDLGGLIGGFRNGIPLIKPGGRIYLYIPPSLGYGSQAVGNIPANSILIFRVDLVAVN